MRLILLPICFLFSPLIYAIEDDDFWLMLDDSPQSMISINAGQSDTDETFYGGYINLAVTEDFYLKASASTYKQKSSIDINLWSLGFGNNPQDEYSWNANYERWGNADTLETTDTVIDFNMYKENWNAIAGIEIGKVNLQGLAVSTDINHRAFKLGFGYNGQYSYWEITHQLHKYDADLEKLNFSPILFILQPLLLRIITPGSQQQATALADNITTLRTGWNNSNYNFEIYYLWIESAVTRTVDELIRLNINKQLTNSTNIGIELGNSIGGGPVSAALILNYSW